MTVITDENNHNVCVEYPRGRTYGECVYDEIMSIQMIEGKFISTLHIKDKPKRMKRSDALTYYTQKLRDVWGNHPLNDSNPL
ncbi:MAG: hypothetical protein PHI47_12180 [Sulfuricurvum sp.]|uniref:hypothetical protein n=1 Tax=Sulfuricurvum sp. TaxID=2025608 RepID=UPI00260516CA|nr:hypothetical protein [Sulfuricurvum sp.]MDD5160806.1 hypothetical protein [Sulfuricurvum sp.]